MNRFMPAEIKQKHEIDLEDQKRFEQVEIPDSDSSED